MSIDRLIGKKYERLVESLIQFEDDLESYPDHLTMVGKTLATAQYEQSGWCAYYGERANKLKHISNRLEADLAVMRSIAFINIKENHTRDLQRLDIDRYLGSDKDIIEKIQLQLEVDYLLGQYTVVCDAFKTRGFVLKDVTAARIHDVQAQVLL